MLQNKKFKLYDWFNRNKTRIEESGIHQSECAQLASQELGFQVNTNHVQALASTQSRAAIYFEWPLQRARLANVQQDTLVNSLRNVAKGLDLLMNEFNVVNHDPNFAADWAKTKETLGL